MIKVLKKLKHLMPQKLLPNESEKSKVLLAQNLAFNNRLLKSIHDFGDIEFSCFSQYGEDGIIDWIITKLPMIPKKFVEFEVEDYKESNTRLLLQLRNWKGLIMDGSNDFIHEIKSLLESISAYPSIFREARSHTGKLLLLGGLKRSEIVKNCPLFDLKTKKITSINKLGEIYSLNWKNIQKSDF